MKIDTKSDEKKLKMILNAIEKSGKSPQSPSSNEFPWKYDANSDDGDGDECNDDSSLDLCLSSERDDIKLSQKSKTCNKKKAASPPKVPRKIWMPPIRSLSLTVFVETFV